MRIEYAASLSVLALTTLVGCYEELRIDDPDGSPPPWDAAAYVDAGPPDGGRPDAYVPPQGKCVQPAGVDLLFVVDSSNSMVEEQAKLADQLPAMVQRMISPPDLDGDMEPDWLPVDDLRVGVITPDMGTGGFAVPTCTNPDFGDDGILRTQGNIAVPGCMATYPSFLSFDPTGGITAAEFAADVACVTTVGTGGCGFEQQLEAVLKALSPDMPTASTGPTYTPPTFFMGTSGHGLDANAGFVRDDSLLAVVIVSDEGDCSAADPDLFNPASATYTVDLNLRCARYPEALHPISRYVDGLAALRADRPDLLAFGLIAGVPPDLAVSQPADADFAAILADPRMVEEEDPMMPSRLRPSCETAAAGVAFPPRRMVSVARGLGGSRSTVQSICQDDFTPAAEALARLFGTRACTARMD